MTDSPTARLVLYKVFQLYLDAEPAHPHCHHQVFTELLLQTCQFSSVPPQSPYHADYADT